MFNNSLWFYVIVTIRRNSEEPMETTDNRFKEDSDVRISRYRSLGPALPLGAVESHLSQRLHVAM